MKNEISAILVSGVDAQKFLQGQLTCDMNLLTKDHPIRGAHCNQKGRVEAIYDISLSDEGILLVTPTEVVQHAFDKLQHYARFSKVMLHIKSLQNWPFRHDLTQHQVRLYPETLGRYLPQELKLDQQGAVSFTKGCYLGQEIVARLHYLGQLKKELHLIQLDSPAKPTDVIHHPQWGEAEVVDSDKLQALILCKKNA